MGQLLVHLYQNETAIRNKHFCRRLNRITSCLFGVGSFGKKYLHGLALRNVHVHVGLAIPTLLWHSVDILRRLQQRWVPNGEKQTNRLSAGHGKYSAVDRTHELLAALFRGDELLRVRHSPDSRHVQMGDKINPGIQPRLNYCQIVQDAIVQALHPGILSLHPVWVVQPAQIEGRQWVEDHQEQN